MNRETKNLKIGPEVHQRLKVQAALAGMHITDYADMLLTLAMSETEVWQRLRLAELAKLDKAK